MRYAGLQAKPETTIHDGFYNFRHPVDTTALPISIYHSVFQSFTDNITPAKPNKELLADVHAWMRTSTEVGQMEEPLAERLRDALSKFLGKEMVQMAVDYAIPDGVVSEHRPDCTVPLLVMEYNRSLGGGDCDPLTQASHSAWKFWRQKKVCA